jgi:hypothetical protein
MKSDLELRYDSKVSASTSQRPEKVRVGILVGPQRRAIRKDQGERLNVVARQPVKTA